MKITGAPHRRRAIPTLPAGYLAAALDVVQRETGRAKVHMFGESSGAIRAGAFRATGARPGRATDPDRFHL